MPRKWRAKTIRIGNRTRCNLLSERPEHVWILTEIRLSEDSGDLLSTRYSLAPRIKLQHFHPPPPFPNPYYAFPHVYVHHTHTREFQRKDISRIEIERNKRRNTRKREGSAAIHKPNFQREIFQRDREPLIGERNGSKICDKRVHVNATRYARRPQICGGPLLYPRPGIHRYVQGISEGLRSTRILQNKRVCVKFLFQGMGRRRRRGEGAQTPEFLGGLPLFCTAFGQREHALLGGRMERG